MSLYLTPIAVNYLTQIILVILITGYLLTRLWRKPGEMRLLWAIAAFATIGLFITALFVETAALPTPRLLVVYLQNSLLALSFACFIQFAYHFPRLQPGMRREARLAGLFSLLYTLGEIGFALYRFQQLANGVVLFREPWLDYLMATAILWVAVSFYRQLIALSRNATADEANRWRSVWIAPLLWPPDQEARAARNFVFIFAFLVGVGLLNVLQSFYLISMAARNVAISLGILLSLLAFGLTYVTYRPETTSFIARLGGIIVTLVLAILGTAAWLIAPVYEAEYMAHLPQLQSVAFTPNAAGGYDVAPIPFYFEEEMGQLLPEVIDGPAVVACQVDWPFDFPFFGQLRDRIYICDDGILGIGQRPNPRNYQYRYGHGVPLIMPLLLDLYPQISDGGVYARQEGDRLIVTWYRLRGFNRPDLEATFQAVLFSDGRFHFNYLDLPDQIVYRANDAPSAAPWLTGALPGGRDNWSQPDPLDPADLPQQIGPVGGVQDHLHDFRAYLHRLLRPLARLSLVSALFIIIALPILLYFTLSRPLNGLLAGVRRLEQGDYDLNLPIYFQDEIGFLTQTANGLSQKLGDLVQNLEMRVVERTQELSAAKAVAEAESQRAAAAAQAKTAFLAHMSHELRTPLNAILGFSDLMSQDADLTRPQRDRLNIINRSGEHLLALINDVLDFSKIDANRVAVNAAPFDLRRLLDDLIPMFSLRATQKGLRLTADLDPALPDHIMTDQSKLRQILINLLGNAVKFTLVGEINLRVRLSDDRTTLQFIVEDSGVGVAPEDLERIFDPFVQTQIPNQLQEGTGLGLAISREFARLLEGDLRVSSVIGQGSVFTLELPLRRVTAQGGVDGAATTSHAAQVIGLAAAQPAYRLLAVDDAPTTRQLLLELLRPLGFAVIEAENGRQAVDIWRIWQPHLIFMDINMPEMDGFAATRQIRAESAADGPVIIAMTANVSLEDRQAAQAAGCDDFLAKPFPLSAALSALAQHLGVVYLYSHHAVAQTAVRLDEAAVVRYLAALPAAWLTDLAAAAQSGDVNWLNQLLREWPGEDTAVADYLSDLTNKFDHERLHNLATSCLRSR
jgi:signal transduction histidine kinase/CheY-like chemotaxis protein